MVASVREAGAGCPHCAAEVATGDPVVICEACGTVHHQGCWDERAGCGSYSCARRGAGDRDRSLRARPPDHPGGNRTRHPAPRRRVAPSRGLVREPDLEPGRAVPSRPEAHQAPDQPARDRIPGLRPGGNPPPGHHHRSGRRGAGPGGDEQDPHPGPARGLAGGLRLLARDRRLRGMGRGLRDLLVASRPHHRADLHRAATRPRGDPGARSAPPARHESQCPHRANRRHGPPWRQGDRIGRGPPHRSRGGADRHQSPCGRPRFPLPEPQCRRAALPDRTPDGSHARAA